MLDCWEAIDEVAQVLTVATSDKDRFFGAAIAVLDATIKAIAAAIMQSSFIIAPRLHSTKATQYHAADIRSLCG